MVPPLDNGLENCPERFIWAIATKNLKIERSACVFQTTRTKAQRSIFIAVG
jgi:hypothetical protein